MAGLSINELTTYRRTFEEDVLRCRDSGFEAIGVWRQKLSDFGEEKGIELLRELDLPVSNLLWAGGFTGSDGRSFRDSLADAVEAIELAGAMGASALVCYSGSRSGHTYSHARRLLVTALRQLEPYARREGVVLAVEPMHPGCAEPWTFLTSLDDTLELLDDLASPYVQLVFDTYHLGHEPGIVGRCREIASRVAVVHLADARHPPRGEQDRCLLGRGVLPLSDIISALADGGYEGYFDVELLGEQVEFLDYEHILNKSLRTFARLAVGVH